MRIFVTIIIVPFFAHWTCSLISRQWCCCLGGNIGECRSLISFRGRMCFPVLLMLPLSLNTNYDGITVRKQSAYRAIILAKILSYASRAEFPHFLKAFPSLFLITILI